MQAKIILLVTIGLVLVLASASGTLMFVRQAEGRVAEVEERLRNYGTQVRLPALSRNVERGELLQASDFTHIPIPASIAPDGALRALPSESGGLIALTDISSHRLILPHQLALAPAHPDAGVIPTADPRVMRIRPANFEDVAEVLGEGDNIDIFWVRSIGGGSFETRVLGRAVSVIGFSALTKESVAQEGWISVGATAELVARVIQAESSGSLYVAISGNMQPGSDGELVVDDSVLKTLPLVERRVEIVKEVSVDAGPDSTEVAEQPTRTETGLPADTLRFLAQRAMDAAGSPKDPPEKCTLTVVKGGQRTVLEVPCR